MPFYIGENKIVDRYVGDKLVIAAYKGESKYFDAYSEITGTLPIIFKSRAAVALKNYRIYGTENGAGVETENLCPAITEENGWRKGYRIANSAVHVSNNEKGEFLSPKIPFDATQSIVVIAKPVATPSMSLYYWNGDTYLGSPSSTNYNGAVFRNHSAGTTHFEIAIRTGAREFADVISSGFWITIIYGSTAPTAYIPFGYKLPLTITSGTQSQDYPLYIGSTKLGEEEYVDFGEQKVYKRTKNLLNWDDVTDGYTLSQITGLPISAKGRCATLNPIDVKNYDSVTLSYIAAGKDIRFMYALLDEYDVLIERAIHRPSGFAIDTSTADYLYLGWYLGIDTQITKNDIADAILVEGSTAPETYIPYLQPTDPPVPLPEILTYQGENTLSSSETLGEATIKGRINELPT